MSPGLPLSESIYGQIAQLERAGSPFVVVILVEALGSTPQDTGAKMIVTPQGLHGGTVGGGRVEAKAIAEAQTMLAAGATAGPGLKTWTLKGDVGMTCGGSVKLYFEPHPAGGAAWVIAIFGAGHVTQALIPVLLPLPCRIEVYDTRSEWLSRLPVAPNLCGRVAVDLAEVVATLPPGAFLLSMTQGHATDRPVLRRAFARGVFPYIGCIGSASKATVLRGELAADGITADQLAKLHCPIGLDFGTNHPHEIALSIAAQLVSVRDHAAG